MPDSPVLSAPSQKAASSSSAVSAADASDPSARRNPSRGRHEHREHGAAVGGVGKSLKCGVERQDQVGAARLDGAAKHGFYRGHAYNFRVSPLILADKAFVQATITNFFFFLSLNCFILLPLYVENAGGTEIEIGLVMGVFNAVGILCQPLVGPWVDAFGRRPFMLVGAGLVVAAAVLATAAPSIPVLAIVRGLQGIGFSAFFVANYSYVLDLTPPERRGWALGIYGVPGLVATAVAPLIGEAIVRKPGFRPLLRP